MPSEIQRLTLPLVVVLLAVVASGCGDRSGPVPAPATPQALAKVSDAFDECVRGDIEAGLADLDAIVRQSPRDPDALVARGLCRWAQWNTSGEESDARDAYSDLSDAIEAVDDGAQPGTPLDQIYSHRAFVAQSLDQAWVRAIEDLDRAVDLAPRVPRHVLDRGVARAYAGDTTAARADLDRFLTLVGDSLLPGQQRVAQALLDDLEPTSDSRP